MCLHNYPAALRKLERIDGQFVDLATLDLVRDRERGVPRYNDFREMLNMPRRRSIDEITPNKEWAREINEIYGGDVDLVDRTGDFRCFPQRGGSVPAGPRVDLVAPGICQRFGA